MESRFSKPQSFSQTASNIRHDTQRVQCLKIFGEFYEILWRLPEGRQLIASTNPLKNLPDDFSPYYLLKILWSMLIVATRSFSSPDWQEIEDQARCLLVQEDRGIIEIAMEALKMEPQTKNRLRAIMWHLEMLSYSIN